MIKRTFDTPTYIKLGRPDLNHIMYFMVYERGSNDSFFIDTGFMDMRIDLKENTKFIFPDQLKHLQQCLTNAQKNN